MLWCLCSSFLTSDALIQAPAICTCLEGKCWPSIPRPDTNQAHFNVNNHPRRGSMINVSFSCHGLIPNPGDSALHCKLLSQGPAPCSPQPCYFIQQSHFIQAQFIQSQFMQSQLFQPSQLLQQSPVLSVPWSHILPTQQAWALRFIDSKWQQKWDSSSVREMLPHHRVTELLGLEGTGDIQSKGRVT